MIPVLDKLEELMQLKQGWDSYDGKPMPFAVAAFVYFLWETLRTPETPIPSVVPGGDGTIQLEWHTHELGDVELTVTAPYEISAWREKDGVEESFDLTDDFSTIKKWLNGT